jgi:cysteinyl-tRNA synthetase
MLKFYNTMTRKKEKFEPIGDAVRIYTCGPTVYNYLHIGNYKTYVFEDLLRRYLKYKGYSVFQVMNITDVDDKTIRDSQKQGKSLREFTNFYVQSFFEDIKALNIEKAEVYPRATEHIKEMVKIIEVLLEKKHAYKADDGSIYFDISSFPAYGKLSKLDKENLKIGARVSHDEYEKEEMSDFCLWKAWNPKDGEVYWETKLGKGRPGWHIECSAMSMKYLGESFDIHCGGVDNIFPHHENEIAQSECYSGKRFVKYWLHSEHLIVDGKKMSKSLGNFYTLRDILGKGYTGREIRYALISTHYRQKLNFTFERLKASRESLRRIDDFLHSLKLKKTKADISDLEFKKELLKLDKGFSESLDDDLNISGALGHLFEFIKFSNSYLEKNASISEVDYNETIHLFKKLDSCLGFLEVDKEEEIPSEIKNLVLERWKAKKGKNYQLADEIRDKLQRLGYQVKDLREGTTLQNVKTGANVIIYPEKEINMT